MLQQMESQVVDLLVLVTLSVLTYVAHHVKTYVAAHTTTQQRELVKELINDAVPYVKTLYPDLDPQTVLQKASDHVVAIATDKGLKVDEREIKAATSAVLSALH